ncbi:bifunctional hydroxymethylpyrimidine kinase/phosphomethylpyrimidine kinase [Paracoccus fistulariae]|uniref:hydroxymethylpyrimidine kinase n=1 Tax=Paracoccus fistulariae TaxID=658446 RepID=A0ABY7SQT8_9RHOB|nr:bifunctional hydroxymethylpyrimidine kinase/phosphomethylpyrimidine kinase [Paracoccus fistulariae]MDB6180294.1 bifunctional hydroxymethylpyrimidine kinase/phosphomethylpyrimidine kinase [Paracoccus fistulariae]WCR08377.1 bifunctional hydroxymethylpyrimidine kinase/phosphomethylpyrimidine kinase [Paracoccus fistulariae]
MRGTARLLIIAGSDSGGGAGIQADLKTASARGVYASTAITAITAQNTQAVQAVELLSPALVQAQIRAVLQDIGTDAIKIGMLGSAPIAQGVAQLLSEQDIPVVLDPVMIAKSGDALLDPDAVAVLRGQLLGQATLLTPNLPEAACLLNAPVAKTAEQIRDQGRALMGMGARAVLMKGGHAAGPVCTDWLLSADGVQAFEAPRIDSPNTHGTGCSLSSAIASELAKGRGLVQAVAAAHGWLQGAIRAADRLQIGQGHGPVHHFHEIWA